jgi:DNA-directed RNA polymerase subunit RPC12/RpoP
MTDKICSKCGVEKDLLDFYTDSRRNKPRAECKQCINKSNRSWYKTVSEENGERLKNHRRSGMKTRLKLNFDLTLEQYEELLKSQNYECAVCQRHVDNLDKRMAVDHAHVDSDYYKVGEIRGLLCEDCNLRLIGDRVNPEIFMRAANYLMGKIT